MKGNTLRNRLIVLAAAAALLMVGAVPVYAAPGGVPGPPAGHEKSHEKSHGKNATTPDSESETDVDTDTDTDTSHVPDWANAYGRRIIDEFGMPYGHLQQCADQSAAAGDEAPEVDDAPEVDAAPSNGAVTCPEEPVAFPEDAPGAKAFWLFVLLTKVILPVTT